MYTHTPNFDKAIIMIAKKVHATVTEVRALIDGRKNRNDFAVNGHEVIFIKDGKGYHFAVEY